MRVPLIALLLLSAAVPAIAAEPDEGARPERSAEDRPSRSERPAPRFERAERPERAERAERPEPRFAPRAERPERAEPPEPRAERPRPAFEAIARRLERAEPSAAPSPVQLEARQDRPGRVTAPQVESEGRPTDSVAGWRWRERSQDRRGRPAEVPPAPLSPVLAAPQPTPDTAVRNADNQRGLGGVTSERRMNEILRDRIAAEGWRKEWRRDRRYDWRRHRDWDRRRFHVGIYVDPFGWRYRHWDLGWRLPSRFYSSRYRISDPWYYRLPPVYGSFRWIRYYDDVLLVDLRTGRVVDRIRNFFW